MMPLYDVWRHVGGREGKSVKRLIKDPVEAPDIRTASDMVRARHKCRDYLIVRHGTPKMLVGGVTTHLDSTDM